MAPPPESGWGHAPCGSPCPAAMWSPDWQLSRRSWWESLSSSWSGACPLSHEGTAPCTYRLEGGVGREGAEGGGGEIEKMDVETETRSGGRLEGQLYQVDGDKTENSVSTFFMRLFANFSWQYAPVQRVLHLKKWVYSCCHSSGCSLYPNQHPTASAKVSAVIEH